MWVRLPPQALMDKLAPILLFTRADSFGSIILRGLIWLILVIIIVVGLDNGKARLGIKSDVGWFLLIICTLGLVSIFVFGFLPTF